MIDADDASTTSGTPNGRWQRCAAAAATVLLLVGSTAVSGVFVGWATSTQRPLDAVLLTATWTLVHVASGTGVWSHVTDPTRPLARWMRTVSVAEVRRAERALARLDVPEGDQAHAAGCDLAVRRRIRLSTTATWGAFLLLSGLVPLAGTFGGAASRFWSVAACCVLAVLVMGWGTVTNARTGEPGATRTWHEFEVAALLDTPSHHGPSLTVRRRHAVLTRLADALAADLTAARLTSSATASVRAARVRAAVLARAEAVTADPSAEWHPQELTPLYTAWVTGAWKDLPDAEPTAAHAPATSLRRFLTWLVLLAAAAVGGSLVLQQFVDDLPVLGASLVVAVGLAKALAAPRRPGSDPDDVATRVHRALAP